MAIWLEIPLILLLGGGCGTVLTPQPILPSPSPTTLLPVNELAVTVATATVQLTPLLPTPTFTPVPSPTPVIHNVESGDTLFGIALEYGVLAEAIQEQNGMANPNALRIGQALIIPLGEPASEDAAPMVQGNLILYTPTPIPLPEFNVELYPTAVGGIWCLGELVNSTTEPLTNLQVQVTLLDELGTPLVTKSTLAATDYLAPEQRAPFSVLFAAPPPEAVKAEALLRRAEPIGGITSGFQPLEASRLTGSISGPQYRVAGQITNQAAALVERVTVVITLYDDEDKILAYRKARLTAVDGLASNHLLEFALLLTPRGKTEPTSFQVLAWGYQGD